MHKTNFLASWEEIGDEYEMQDTYALTQMNSLEGTNSNSDQNIISPNNINTSSCAQVMRIRKMITKEECRDVNKNSPNRIRYNCMKINEEIMYADINSKSYLVQATCVRIGRSQCLVCCKNAFILRGKAR